MAIAATALLIGFIGYLNIAIAFVSAGILILTGVAVPLLAHRLAGTAARRLNVETARMRTEIVDGIQGMAALLTCGAESAYLDRLARRHQALVLSQKRMSRVTGLSGALISLAAGLCVIGTLYLGVEAVRTEALSGPCLALLVLAVMAGFDAVGALPTAYQYLGRTTKAANRLLNVTENPAGRLFSRPFRCETR